MTDARPPALAGSVGLPPRDFPAGVGGAAAGERLPAVVGPAVVNSAVVDRVAMTQAVAHRDGAGSGGTLPDVAEPERARRRRLLPAPIWRIGKLLVVALIVEYLVVPQIAGTRKALHLLSGVNAWYLALGTVLELVSIASYTQLTRAVLPPDDDPGTMTILRVQLTTTSVSHCVPGGSAAGSSIGYRLLSAAGVRKADVGFALATQSLGSALVLNVIFWLALVVSIPVWGFSPLYMTAAVVGVVLVVLFGVLIGLLTRGEEWAAAGLGRLSARIPFIDDELLRRSFLRVAVRLQELLRQRRLLVRATLWAAANWILDAASLWVFIGAFGHWVNPDGLLVSFGLANVLAAVPLTPGGLGVVEATLTSTLVGFNTPRGIAILGVVTYRLINFWLPIPLGGLTYLSLQVDPGDRSGRGGASQASPTSRILSRFSGSGSKRPTPDRA